MNMKSIKITKKSIIPFGLVTMVILLFATFVACSNLTPQERQARNTVKTRFKQAPNGSSYEPIAWGRVEYNSSYAGTGTKNPIFGETGTPPSAYSMAHRLKMRNGFGNVLTFDVRVFFTNESCTEWAGMEYMSSNDPTRHLMQE